MTWHSTGTSAAPIQSPPRTTTLTADRASLSQRSPGPTGIPVLTIALTTAGPGALPQDPIDLPRLRDFAPLSASSSDVGLVPAAWTRIHVAANACEKVLANQERPPVRLKPG